jgi:excisionase family DNA binding protein
MPDPKSQELAEDLIWGVDGENGIAAYLNLPVRKTYRLIAAGKLPVLKLGHRTITASKSKLRRHFTTTQHASDNAA